MKLHPDDLDMWTPARMWKSDRQEYKAWAVALRAVPYLLLYPVVYLYRVVQYASRNEE